MTTERARRWAHASFDPVADAIGIYFAPEGAVAIDSVEVAPGVTLDYDQHNRVIGVDVLGVRDLLATGRTLPPFRCPAPYNDVPDPFQAALDRYNKAFPDEGLPFLFGLSPEDFPVAVALLHWAAARGRPLNGWQIMAALGIEEPPEGVVI